MEKLAACARRSHTLRSIQLAHADGITARSGAGNQLLRVTAGRGPTGTGYSVAAVLRGAEGRARLRVWPRRYHVAQARFVSDSERLAPGATFSEHALPRLNLRRT